MIMAGDGPNVRLTRDDDDYFYYCKKKFSTLD